MAGKENLISLGDRTTEEQRAIASMGGKASGEARRQRKAMREQAEFLLSLPFQDIKTQDRNGNTKSVLEEFKKVSGIENAEDIDNQMAMVIAMWKQVLQGGKGSVQAFESLRDLVGEKKTSIDLNGGLQVNFNGESDLED